jgi:hypothetical protein
MPFFHYEIEPPFIGCESNDLKIKLLDKLAAATRPTDLLIS